jgi:hypothetical protein
MPVDGKLRARSDLECVPESLNPRSCRAKSRHIFERSREASAAAKPQFIPSGAEGLGANGAIKPESTLAREEIGIGNHVIAGLEKQAGLYILRFSRRDRQRLSQWPIKQGSGDAALLVQMIQPDRAIV